MPTAWIPPLLRDLTGGKESVAVPGTTVAEVIESLEAQFPGIRPRLCHGDDLRAGISVAVDAEVSRRGLRQKVGENSEVHFLPAVAGR